MVETFGLNIKINNFVSSTDNVECTMRNKIKYFKFIPMFFEAENI